MNHREISVDTSTSRESFLPAHKAEQYLDTEREAIRVSWPTARVSNGPQPSGQPAGEPAEWPGYACEIQSSGEKNMCSNWHQLGRGWPGSSMAHGCSVAPTLVPAAPLVVRKGAAPTAAVRVTLSFPANLLFKAHYAYFFFFLIFMVQVNYIFLLGEVKSQMAQLEGGIGIKLDLQSLLEVLLWEVHLLPTQCVFLTLSVSSPAGSPGTLGKELGVGTITTGDSESPNMCLVLIILLSVTDPKYKILRVRIPFATLISKHVLL